MAALRGAWEPPPPLRLHPARASLELPLTLLPSAAWLARCYLVLMAVYAAQLLWLGHWVVAIAMAALTAATCLAFGRMVPQGPGAPRRLLLAADGRLHVSCVGGAVEPVELAGESIWLGSAVLLVLQAPGRRHRVLLGRGNLDPAVLATLRRRLRGAAVPSADTAVDSPGVYPQSTNAIEQFKRGNQA